LVLNLSFLTEFSCTLGLQAIETQQSQTAPPGPLPESQFIASCRDELPPPRPPTKTLGLKKKNKQQVSKKKENQVPDV
jgi:hypothetical protein